MLLLRPLPMSAQTQPTNSPPVPSLGARGVYHSVTSVFSDGSEGPIVLLLQTEPNGQIIQFTLRLLRSLTLRAPGEPLRAISFAHNVSANQVAGTTGTRMDVVEQCDVVEQ